MSCNNNCNGGLFGNDWIWIIIAVIIIVCLCNDNNFNIGNDCCNDRCDCC